MNGSRTNYLLYEKAERIGTCRFCGTITRITVRPPEIIKQIRTPVYVCPKCRTIRWKMDDLGKLFNRTVVDRIIQVLELAVIPVGSQLRPQMGVSIKHTEKSRIFEHIGDWIAEPKINGIRLLAYIQEQQVRFLTSDYNNRTREYEDITDHIKHLQLSIPELAGTVLDGVLSTDDTKPFHLQDEVRDLTYTVFDCLKYRGTDIRGLELEVRQCSLTKVFRSIGEEHQYWEHIEISRPTNSDELLELFEKSTEGLMLKNLRSPYHAPAANSRTKDWIKWEKERK